MEAAEDEFEFARIGIDIPDGKDTGHVGTVVEGIDLDSAFIYLKAPVGDRAEFGRQAEKRDKMVGGLCDLPLVFLFDEHGVQSAISAQSDRFRIRDQVDPACAAQFVDFLHRIGGSPEFFAPMDKGYFLGYLR